MNIRKQRGLTLVGFAIVLVLGLFFAYSGMRIIPMYLEYHSLLNALSTLERTQGAIDLTPEQIRNKIMNSLWVSYAGNTIQRRHIRITRSEGIQVRVAYESRRPWVGNLDVVGKFDKTVMLRR